MATIGRFWLSAAVSMTAIAGCQSVLPSAGYRQAAFSLGQDDSAVAIAGRPAASLSGELRVNFADILGNLKQRRILSTVADVDHVTVTVTPESAAAVTQTVAKAAIAAGQTTASFSGLPVGTVGVTVTIYDATGASLGTTTRQAVIVVNQTATVDLIVQLPSTTVATGGGGTSPATGGLDASVIVQEGAVIENLPGGGTLETYKMPFKPYRIAVSSSGAAWVSGSNDATHNYLARLSPSGTLEKVIQSSTVQFQEVYISPIGHVWVFTSNAEMQEYDDDGVLVNSYPKPVQLYAEPPAFDGVDTFASGSSGLSGHIGMSKLGDATVTNLSAADTGIRNTFGKNDDIWTSGSIVDDNYDTHGDWLVRVSRTGAQLSKVSLGTDYLASYVAVDAQGNGWLTGHKYTVASGVTDGRVYKFSPTGQLLGSTALSSATAPQGIYFEPSGRMWVLNNGGTPSATWLDANGVEKGHVDLPDMDTAWFGAAGVSGVWALGYTAKTIYRVAPAVN